MNENNPFPYSNTEKRYHTLNYHLREHFGHKVFKVALDGGFDCPNRDGTVAHGGAHSAARRAPAILPAIGPMTYSRNFTILKTACTKSGKTANISHISVAHEYACPGRGAA